MICDTIDLYKYFGIERKQNAAGGFLSIYARSPINEMKPKKRPAMLILPGGGYDFVSVREGEPVALRFLGKGYSSFVLNYSTKCRYPAPLLEACMAVIYIRKNADKYSIDANHVAAIGFSAGGHLAAMLSTLWFEKEIADVLGKDSGLARLNAVILSYPVISMGEYTHGNTRENITANDAELTKKLSIENMVTENSVPAFIWHTVEDNCVPVENSILLALAYKKVGVPFALHLFEKGWHGLSLCNKETNNQTEDDVTLEHVGKWFDLAVDWLTSRGFKVTVKDV